MQLRPEDEASDDEFAAILRAGSLKESEAHRVRMEQEPIPVVKLSDYSGIIVGGGPSNVSDDVGKKSGPQQRFEKELHELLDQITQADFPYLGACYGLGALAEYLGGIVSKEKYGEDVAATTIRLTDAAKSDPITKDLPESFRAFAGHKESCQDVPLGATLLASSEACPVHLIRYKQNIYASQFHPELDADGMETRINTYKHAGYFPPEDADALIAAARSETVTVPMQILGRFVDRYRV